MRFVPSSITRNIGRTVLKTKKNSPHIFFAAGIIGTVGGTVLACRATLKLEKTLDHMKENVDFVKNLELNETTLQTEAERKTLLVHTYAHGTLMIARLYAPAILVGSASIACLTGSHIQLTRRNAALTFTLAAVTKAYEEYRARVQEVVGEKKELDIYRGMSEETYEIDGKKQVVKVSDPSRYSPYARFFDEYNVNWQKDAEYNRLFIECQQSYANHLLKSRGHVFLNDVYDSLGMERSRAGAVVGWVREGDGDGYIDFGIFEATNSRFVNNMERSIILDFNVDGVVYDKI